MAASKMQVDQIPKYTSPLRKNIGDDLKHVKKTRYIYIFCGSTTYLWILGEEDYLEQRVAYKE